MKNKLRYILILFLLCGLSANAQFWKKLKKKVERGVEEVVTNKVAQKTSEKTGQIMEGILNPDFKKNSPVPLGGEQGSLDDVPNRYNFEWAYTLQVESNSSKEKLNLQYYLKKGAPYFGVDMAATTGQKGMFMVYDAANNLTVMFLDMEGNKVATVYKTPKTNAETFENNDDYTFDKIEGKKILGYNCDGFVAENENHKMTYYVTFDAEIGFGDVYGKSQNLPKNFNPEWLKNDGKEGLMMEMVFENKNNPSQNATMQCIELKNKDFTIKKSQYESFAGASSKN